MRFHRGDGPDISLDSVMNGDIVGDDSSSTSSDATSGFSEERARFLVAQQRCASILIFNRKGLLDDVFCRAPQ